MRKARGLVLIPYFGKLPNYFPFWAHSAERVRQIEWLLLTDAEVPCALPSNVRVKKFAFADIQHRIRQHFTCSVKIEKPWDLCAFKPAYGDIFREEYAGYDFWGYGDLDVIYGDLDKFLTDDVMRDYDKIFRWGHLSLLRNTEFWRVAYRTQPENSALNCCDAFNQRVACFDEELFNDIIVQLGGRIDDSQPIAGPTPRSYLLDFFPPNKARYPRSYVAKCHNNKRNVYGWLNGRLIRYYCNEQNFVDQEEFAYIHLFRRKMECACNLGNSEVAFCIVPNKFIEAPLSYGISFIMNHTKAHINWAYILPRLKPRFLMKKIIVHIKQA